MAQLCFWSCGECGRWKKRYRVIFLKELIVGNNDPHFLLRALEKQNSKSEAVYFTSLQSGAAAQRGGGDGWHAQFCSRLWILCAQLHRPASRIDSVIHGGMINSLTQSNTVHPKLPILLGPQNFLFFWSLDSAM